MKKTFLNILLFFMVFTASAQVIEETNTDIIYKNALELYKKADFSKSLDLTRHGLSLAPGYHDIRILQVRSLWALEEVEQADLHLHYLLEEAPDYLEVLPLAFQRVNKFPTPQAALKFISELERAYPNNTALQLKKAQLLLENEQPEKAREVANTLLSSTDINGKQRYSLQIILNRTVSREIGINYQNISFSDEYSRNHSWNNLSAEYQQNLKKTAVIGRVNYSDRSYDASFLYELEAYPVFSDKFYAYTNIGISEGTLFPDFRSSLSLYYNFAKVFEGEIGGRLLSSNQNSRFTGILGLSLYQGKFLFNIRSFLGPERKGDLIQNYQGNLRYYLSQADNYLFLRLGSGISPDERFNSIQLENPALNAYYSNMGIRHLFWNQHIFQLEAGYLIEDITSERTGNQFHVGVGYRYRM